MVIIIDVLEGGIIMSTSGSGKGIMDFLVRMTLALMLDNMDKGHGQIMHNQDKMLDNKHHLDNFLNNQRHNFVYLVQLVVKKLD